MGNGSDDVLALCFQAFFCSDDPAFLLPDFQPIPFFYPVWCSAARVPYETVPVDEDFRISSRGLRPCKRRRYLPNPEMRRPVSARGWTLSNAFCRATRIPLSSSMKPMLILAEFQRCRCKKYENLVVVRTISKCPLARRLPRRLALANPALIATLEAVKNSYNSYTMDMVTLEAAAASVEDDAISRETSEHIRRAQTFGGRAGGSVFLCPACPTSCWQPRPKKSAKEIFDALPCTKNLCPLLQPAAG